jgi:hypothetical protein
VHRDLNSTETNDAQASFRLRDVDGILPLSCACFLLTNIEGVSAARTLAAKHDEVIDPRQFRKLAGKFIGDVGFAAIGLG